MSPIVTSACFPGKKTKLNSAEKAEQARQFLYMYKRASSLEISAESPSPITKSSSPDDKHRSAQSPSQPKSGNPVARELLSSSSAHDAIVIDETDPPSKRKLVHAPAGTESFSLNLTGPRIKLEPDEPDAAQRRIQSRNSDIETIKNVLKAAASKPVSWCKRASLYLSV
jgi:hypothetical protein